MPEGFYKIVVVCEHWGRPFQGKTRVIDRLSWLETDPEDEAGFRASMAEGGFDEAVLQIVLMNDRFGRRGEWRNKSGRAVRPQDSSLTYWAGSGVDGRARALGGFRFRCACGIDRPVRQDTLDTWIRSRLAEDEARRVHHFEISR